MVEQKNLEVCVETELSALDIEKKMLGALIGKRTTFDMICGNVNKECFSTPANVALFNTIESVVNAGEDPDIMILAEKAKATNLGFDLTMLTDIYGEYHGEPISRLTQILDIFRKKRVTYYTALDMINRARRMDLDIDECIKSATSRLTASTTNEKIQDVTMDDIISEVLTDAKEYRSGIKQNKGSYTGFPFIDDKGGLKYSSLIVIAAETSQGKTSLALNLAINALTYGAKVAFYSMEMTNKELVSRVLSSRSGVSSSNIQYQKLFDNEMYAIEKAASGLSSVARNMHFDDRSESNIDNILSSIRAKKIKYNIDGAIIDYLQILNVTMRSTNKEQAMGDIARKLKNLAKELNIWIIALSQLSRDKEHPEPTIARLRDSGQIAEAADEVYLIFRPEVVNVSAYPSPYEGYSIKDTAMIIRAKGRGIGLTREIVGFDAGTTTFYYIDKEHLPTVAASIQQSSKPVPF